MSRTLLFVLLALPAAAQTQRELNDKACTEAAAAEEAMNAAYAKALAAQPAVKKAQKAWLAFRDAHLAALFPAEGRGSVHAMCDCFEKASLAKHRALQLKAWAERAEGDACAPITVQP